MSCEVICLCSLRRIRPIDEPGFIVAQLGGAAAATLLFRWLVPSLPKKAEAVMLAHAKTVMLAHAKK